MSTAPDQATLEAALLLLNRLGVTPDDLVADSAPRQDVPTFAQYVPKVVGAVSPGMRKAYGSYWNRIIDRWGERRLDEPKPIEVEAFVADIRASALVRANTRGGRSAAENCVAAFRCLYKRAAADDLITEGRNPAARVAKPRRVPTNRRALSEGRLEEVYEVAAATGDDPELDSLIVRLHVETACRRGGALALKP